MENSLMEISRKRRDRFNIMAEILDIARDGSRRTRIMYSANLSFNQLNEYLSFLLKRELLKRYTENGKRIYKTTAKGLKYLESYKEISNLLRKGEGEGNPVKGNIRMVNCPGCGKPLVKRSSKGRYYCENDGCLVVFVRRPHNLAIRKIFYEPSASENAIRRIEKR